MLGMVFGVGSVIAMLAIGEGASAEALERIRRLGSQNIMVSAQKPPEEQGGSREQKNRTLLYGLLYDDVEKMSETISCIDRVAPAKILVKPCTFRDVRLDMRVVCTTPDWFELVDRDVVAGRALVADDELRGANVAVLTEWGARKVLAGEHALGETVVIGSTAFRVVGIVRSESSGAAATGMPDRQTDVYIPLASARQRFGDVFFRRTQDSVTNERCELHEIIAHVTKEKLVEPASRAVARLLESSHPKKDYAVEVPLQLLHQAEATKRTFSIVLGAIAGISLLVGGIGIMNIMLASVTERTREIGIRRAIGARRRQVVAQFLIESVVLSVAGGIVGMVLGVAIPFAVTAAAGMPTVITAWSLLLSFGISVAVGVCFGIYPAMRAADLDPIIALRYE